MKTVISLNEHEKTCNFIDQDPCFQNMKGTDWRRRVICYVGMFTIRDLLKRFIRNVSSFFFFNNCSKSNLLTNSGLAKTFIHVFP